MNNNDTRGKNVPELRFPEFRGSEEWEEKRLKDIGEFVGGGTPDTVNSDYWDGEIQWFTPTEIKGSMLTKSIRTITYEGLKNSSAKLLPIGAILITTRATIGDIAITTIECSTNQGFQSLIVSEKNINIFWYYWIAQNKEVLKRKASGSTFSEISKNEIKKIEVHKPIKNEQQKIAACLFSLDDLITEETQKLETLKTHKKGLMQKLFPVEGSIQPEFRFEEFRNLYGWEEKRIGDIGHVVTGKTPDTKKESAWNGDILFITPTDIKNEKKYQENSDRTVVKNNSMKVLPVESILFTCIASIGKIAIAKKESITNQQINSIIVHPQFENEFVYYSLLNITPYIKSIPSSSVLPIINKSEFSNLKISLPTQKTEQQKIAQTLTSLDDLITTQTAKIEQLKQHKKGLLQGLFPTANR